MPLECNGNKIFKQFRQGLIVVPMFFCIWFLTFCNWTWYIFLLVWNVWFENPKTYSISNLNFPFFLTNVTHSWALAGPNCIIRRLCHSPMVSIVELADKLYYSVMYCLFLCFAKMCFAYRKVASRSTSRLVARPGIFRLFIKGKFDPYVLWPLAFGLWPLNSRPVYCSWLYGS